MVRPDGGIGRRNGLKIRCPKRTCGFDPRSGYHFFEYFGISCALLSSSTRSSTVVHSLATSSAKHNLCSNYFKKTCGFYFFVPRSGWGIGLPCVTRPDGLALLRLCAALRLVDPRSGYHFFFTISIFLYFTQFFNWKSADVATNLPQGVLPQTATCPRT